VLEDIEEHDRAHAGRPRIVGWVDWDSDYPDANNCDEDLEAVVVEYVREHRIQKCGECHQKRPKGAPLFADGTVWRDKMAHWAATMSDAWDREGDNLDGPKTHWCPECCDGMEPGAWDTWSGPLKEPDPLPDLKGQNVSYMCFDSLWGSPVVGPNLGARIWG
jgi:hypothetical protein